MELRVKMGEFRVSTTPITLLATSLGSCVGLALFDRETKIGGLAHIMLPDSRVHRQPRPRPGRYADTAIPAMCRQMRQLGGEPDLFVAWIVGGASMFPTQKVAIGSRNVEAVKVALDAMNIQIVDEQVEGKSGRTLIFLTGSGEVRVRRRSDNDATGFVEEEMRAWNRRSI